MTITDFSVFDSRLDHQLLVDVDAAEKDELTAYLDTLGNWTIGRGHLMPKTLPGKTWEGFTIAQSVSDRYFNGDLLNALIHAKALPEFGACDTQARQNALTEICFNMGGKWSAWGPTRHAITTQDWQTVHDHLLNSLWAQEIQPHHYVGGTCSRCGHVQGPTPPYTYCTGIANGRATRIANYFLTGEFPT
jgi:GH24 family phage-related lysozyme (muramidase)